MENYNISESFILPSLGRIYNPSVAPEVTLRSMNTNDEMRRLAPSEYQYKQMSDVIDNCILSGPEISSYDMCLGDYQFLLHRLRMVTYGDELSIKTRCPYCKFDNDDVLKLSELPIIQYNEELNSLFEIELPVTKKIVKLRYQTPRMLDNISQGARDLKKRVKDKNQDFSLLLSLTSMIDTIDGIKHDRTKLESWARELPMKDTNAIYSAATKINNSIGVETELTISCALCGTEYKYSFRPGPDFFNPVG